MGIATTRPAAVVIKAWEMPPAMMRGLPLPRPVTARYGSVDGPSTLRLQWRKSYQPNVEAVVQEIVPADLDAPGLGKPEHIRLEEQLGG